MFKKIMVPVDGSENSWRTLEIAADLAKKFGSEIVVFNAIHPYDHYALLCVPIDHGVLGKSDTDLTIVASRILHAAEKKLEELGIAADKIRCEMEKGHAAEAILDFAEKKEVSVIVIGSRGLSGVKDFFLGGVSSKVSERAKVPVLIVK